MMETLIMTVIQLVPVKVHPLVKNHASHQNHPLVQMNQQVAQDQLFLRFTLQFICYELKTVYEIV